MKTTLRPVVLDDAELLYDWQRHENTRRYFFTPTLPTKDEHVEWLMRSLENRDRYLLIGEVDSQPVGVLRYDVTENEAEVSIYIDPARYGKGLGVELLGAGAQWVKNNLQNIASIKAEIMTLNVQSKKCFEKAGFSESSATYCLELS